MSGSDVLVSSPGERHLALEVAALTAVTLLLTIIVYLIAGALVSLLVLSELLTALVVIVSLDALAPLRDRRRGQGELATPRVPGHGPSETPRRQGLNSSIA